MGKKMDETISWKKETAYECVELLEKSIDALEDYEIGKTVLQKLIRRIQNETDFLKCSAKDQGTILFKLLFLLATAEKNLKNFQSSEESFLKAIALKKDEKYNPDYISLLIDYGSMVIGIIFFSNCLYFFLDESWTIRNRVEQK